VHRISKNGETIGYLNDEHQLRIGSNEVRKSSNSDHQQKNTKNRYFSASGIAFQNFSYRNFTPATMTEPNQTKTGTVVTEVVAVPIPPERINFFIQNWKSRYSRDEGNKDLGILD
jgi:hypothetical protein